MGNVAVPEQLAGIDELYELDASETGPENGDDGEGAGAEPEEMPHPVEPEEMPHPVEPEEMPHPVEPEEMPHP
jgi:hypothetical protein